MLLWPTKTTDPLLNSIFINYYYTGMHEVGKLSVHTAVNPLLLLLFQTMIQGKVIVATSSLSDMCFL